ncbi:GNAT family N-acetyltransferase [Streptomyces sp. DSM 44917]|uniref:GNAT family N-acetyltransferase n=1 Tax=Streptomyces boetiae TaxID=3075541 RepID=A0ABU2LBG0_9ACTN|nr:GNAT family N-acetyltransferase [Streptomyces sp. DSM 44917]MDT0308816.1 GNAT family N-acetyltransferase [Streptomyces sp. DSM 44917]
MTTTLRPAGPEERAPDGARARAFDVRVNGRRAGGLRLSAEPPALGGAGRIEELEIQPEDRRRGRATVAALAAEEVLRGWGCREAAVALPAGAEGPLALAAALGYAERNRFLAKPLPEQPPPLPPGYTARAMGPEEYPAWLEEEQATFAAGWTGRGLSPAAARARAEAARATYLPDGPAGEHTALRVLTHGAGEAGALWVSTDAPRLRHGVDAFVLSVRVPEERRGRGHGRALMREAERVCRAAGGRLLGLNVFAGNVSALRLYASLGYRPVEIGLAKPLL